MDRKDKKVLTLGIFAHANAGKTTITEHLLYHTNVIDKIGRVDTGNTITDNMKIEQERGITVRDSLVSFEIKDKIIQLIDTPGHVDFSAEVERAISVLDGAILVISGVEGIEAQTYTIYRALREKNIPIIIFINKMDRKGANYKRVISELQNNLDIHTITLKQVLQKESGDLEIISSNYDNLIEEISKVDDDILNKFINNQNINKSIIDEKIVDLCHKCKLFPVIGGSALTDIGIDDLVDSIYNYIPVTKKDIDEYLSMFVFMIRINENGKNTYVKVINGSIGLRENIKIDENKICKIKNLQISEGSKILNVDRIYSGDIAIINGLDVKCGDIIGNNEIVTKYINFVKPLLTMEIKSINNKDTIELMNALKILNDEDPYLDIKFNEKTNSIFCSLMGEVQAQIIKTLLDERFGIKVNIENPMVIHREVPTISSKASASYTRVSGITLEITPLERGSGFKYISKVSTDYLPLKYQKQIERLINLYIKQGLKGWEVTDLEIALTFGQFDSIGSNSLHFNIITPLALFRSLKQANIKLLEPISKFIITTKEKHLSDVIKLLSSKESIYEINKIFEGIVTIEGEVPSSNILNFPIELSIITSGTGTFSSYISKYEISKNQDLKKAFIGPDPRNETTFIINDMNSSLESLDKVLVKKKKEGKSKFARKRIKKEIEMKR